MGDVGFMEIWGFVCSGSLFLGWGLDVWVCNFVCRWLVWFRGCWGVLVRGGFVCCLDFS